MEAAAIAPVRSRPIAELPAAALRIAHGFASRLLEGFDAVQIRPGLEDGTVTVLAGGPHRIAQITAQGSCSRALALPAAALRVALGRDRLAEHVAIVEAEAGVSLRTYSSCTTVAVTLPEVRAVQFPTPAVTPGPCAVRFAVALLTSTLRDLAPLEAIELQPYSTGLQITGAAAGLSVFVVVAGVAVE